jgi:hypothetical protein
MLSILLAKVFNDPTYIETPEQLLMQKTKTNRAIRHKLHVQLVQKKNRNTKLKLKVIRKMDGGEGAKKSLYLLRIFSPLETPSMMLMAANEIRLSS